MSELPDTGTWDSTWDDVFASRSWGKYPSESIVRAIMRSFKDVSDRRQIRVLDLGCGPGAHTWFLAREGFTVSGIDGLAVAIAQNQQRLRDEGLTADLHTGDFTARLPWDDGIFDAVIDNVSLCNNPLRAILTCVREVERVLKPGGLFVSLSFTDRTWGYGLGQRGPDPGAAIDIAEGPLARGSYVQFFGRSHLDTVYSTFRERRVERTSYTADGGTKLIEHWLVTCVR